MENWCLSSEQMAMVWRRRAFSQAEDLAVTCRVFEGDNREGELEII